MGLLREPKEVDFYVDDRPLTDEEKRLLKAAIIKNKAKAKRAKSKRTVSARKPAQVAKR